MRLGRVQVSLFLAGLLTVAGCSVADANSSKPSASPTVHPPATSSVRPIPSASKAPSQKSDTPRSAGYDPRYCGVTDNTKTGGASNALLTIDDFPYQDGSVIIKVAKWAKQNKTMMESFPIAQNVKAYDQRHRTNLVAEARALGTYVSNHTYSHADLTQIGSKKAEAQLARGIQSTYVRPPYGAFDSEARKLIEVRHKARVCHWTIDTRDWQRLPNGSYPPAKTLIARVRALLKKVEPGTPVVILGHYQTNYPLALNGIRAELVAAKLNVCAAPAVATTANVPHPIC